MIGLYAITHKASNKAYVGSSHNVERRIRTHKSKLSKGYHHNKHLQNAWVKYGEKSFDIKVIAICKDEKESAELEQAFLDCFYFDNLYNFKNAAFGVGSGKSHPNKGKPLSEEHKRKVSIALKGIGRPHSSKVKDVLRDKSTKTAIKPQ